MLVRQFAMLLCLSLLAAAPAPTTQSSTEPGKKPVKVSPASTQPEALQKRLAKAHAAYEASLKTAREQLIGELAEVSKIYAQAGDVDKAVELLQERDRLSAVSRPAADLTDDLVPSTGSIHRVRDGISVTDPQMVETPNEFAVPLTIETVAKTDSTNIRLYFGANGRLIFNWEQNQTELRLHDPVTGSANAIPGKGKIPAGQWVKIKWVINSDQMTVWANDELRASVPTQLKGVSGKVGVGAGGGSVVTLKSLTITEDKRK